MKTKQLLNVFKLWYERGIRERITQRLFKWAISWHHHLLCLLVYLFQVVRRVNNLATTALHWFADESCNLQESVIQFQVWIQTGLLSFSQKLVNNLSEWLKNTRNGIGSQYQILLMEHAFAPSLPIFPGSGPEFHVAKCTNNNQATFNIRYKAVQSTAHALCSFVGASYTIQPCCFCHTILSYYLQFY